MTNKTYEKLLQTEDGPMKTLTTTPREDKRQNALIQAGRPPQANQAPKCGDHSSPHVVKHHDPSVVIHPEHDKKKKKDERIGFIISLLENKKEPSGYRRGLVVVGSPLGLPPRLPCVPAGQIVINKLARRPQNFIHEETNSYTIYDDEEQERPFKRIRPHDHLPPPLHMVSP